MLAFSLQHNKGLQIVELKALDQPVSNHQAIVCLVVHNSQLGKRPNHGHPMLVKDLCSGKSLYMSNSSHMGE